MLGHLSKESNFPELAYQTAVNEVINSGTDVSKLNLSVANRDKIGNIIHIWLIVFIIIVEKIMFIENVARIREVNSHRV